MRTRTWSVAVAMLAGALAVGCATAAEPSAAPAEPAPEPATESADTDDLDDGATIAGQTVTVHKTPTCACCGDYEAYLEAHGVEVVVEEHDDLDQIKADLGVPDELRSCHTNEIDGYAVEGHVPVEALADLLEQAPDADGIALAGMPPGSPGMPGEQAEPFDVRVFADATDTGSLGDY